VSSIVQKPGVLTTFGGSDYNNNIYLNIRDLTPTIDGQYIPAKSGQGHWLFHEILSVGIFFYRNVVWRLFANMFLCHCNVAGMI
jgi:hypothetical protein